MRQQHTSLPMASLVQSVAALFILRSRKRMSKDKSGWLSWERIDQELDKWGQYAERELKNWQPNMDFDLLPKENKAENG